MAAGGIRYIPNPAFEVQLRNDPQLRAHLRRTAERVRGAAEGNIIFPGARTKSVSVSDGDEVGSQRVSLDGPFGAIEEWGSIKGPARAPLRRAVHSAGLEFDEASRG